MEIGQDNTSTLPLFLLKDHLIGEPSVEVGGTQSQFFNPFPPLKCTVLCKRSTNYYHNNNNARSQKLQSVPEEILIDRNGCSAMNFINKSLNPL